MLSDEELLRYSRHILLPQMDVAGQESLKAARVLVVGLGGLGSPVVLYLAAAGVGHLTLVDDDQVELTNLQRQVAHDEASLGTDKVVSAAGAAKRLNQHVQVDIVNQRVDAAALADQVRLADVVVDCTDNFTTRSAINSACVQHEKPLVSGAAIRFEGQLTVFDVRRDESPCYHCLYQLSGEENLSCAESGVFSPLVGVVGSLQALETLKVIASVGEPAVGKLLLFDALRTQWRELKLKRDSACSVCGQRNGQTQL